ncbi:MAG TPA: hypothetical protein VGH15_10695 [Caulobacteraceae bacterium]
MTTKILTGTYSSGYSLMSGFSGVWAKSTAKVIGAVGTYGFVDGTMGGVGLELPNSVVARNDGVVVGGAGGNGEFSNSTGGAGGGGGVAVVLASGGQLTNTFAIYGGPGGYAHYGGQRGGQGGFGGDGVDFDGKGTLTNSGVIQGGVGQLGASGGSYSGSDGEGGFGVYMRAGGVITNLGRISAGGEGPAAAFYPSSVLINGGGVITNGSATDAFADIDGGNTGNGIEAINDPVTIKNFGNIAGKHFSVLMSSGGRIIAEAGSSFTGEAYGGGGTLELAGGGTTISNIGSTATVSGSITGTFVDFDVYQFDAGGAFTLAGPDNILKSGRTLTDNGALGIANTTVLEVQDGALVTSDTLLGNYGIIALESATKFTDLRLSGAATLDNSGTIALWGGRARILGLSKTVFLDNAGTIDGAGTIGTAGFSLANTASGVIEASGGGSLLMENVADFNSGILAAATGSTLILDKGFVDQSASAGVIAALSGGIVDLADVQVLGGTLSQSGSGILRANVSGSLLDGATAEGPVTIDGTAEVMNGVTLILTGTVDNTGSLDTLGTTATSELLVSGAVSLTGGGQVNLGANVHNAMVGIDTSDTLTNVNGLIEGAGQIGGGTMSLVNRLGGTIAGDSAITLTIDTGAKSITNIGAIESLGTGQVIVKSAIANSGNLVASSGTLVLDGAVSGSGFGRIKAGVLDIAAAFTQNVAFFAGSTGVLRLGDWAGFSGKVSGLSTTGKNSIDILGFSYKGAKATYSGTTAAGVLTVTNGTQTAKIDLTGNYLGSTFTVAFDGHGGVTVKDPPAASASLTQAMAGFVARPPAASVAQLKPPASLRPLLAHAQA